MNGLDTGIAVVLVLIVLLTLLQSVLLGMLVRRLRRENLTQLSITYEAPAPVEGLVHELQRRQDMEMGVEGVFHPDTISARTLRAAMRGDKL